MGPDRERLRGKTAAELSDEERLESQDKRKRGGAFDDDDSVEEESSSDEEEDYEAKQARLAKEAREAKKKAKQEERREKQALAKQEFMSSLPSMRTVDMTGNGLQGNKDVAFEDLYDDVDEKEKEIAELKSNVKRGPRGEMELTLSPSPSLSGLRDKTMMTMRSMMVIMKERRSRIRDALSRDLTAVVVLVRIRSEDYKFQPKSAVTNRINHDVNIILFSLPQGLKPLCLQI